MTAGNSKEDASSPVVAEEEAQPQSQRRRSSTSNRRRTSKKNHPSNEVIYNGIHMMRDSQTVDSVGTLTVTQTQLCFSPNNNNNDNNHHQKMVLSWPLASIDKQLIKSRDSQPHKTQHILKLVWKQQQQQDGSSSKQPKPLILQALSQKKLKRLRADIRAQQQQ